MRTLLRSSLFVCLLGALGAVSTSCGDDLARVTRGELAAIDDFAFPPTLLNRTSQHQLQIRNNGDGVLVVSNIEIVDASPFIQFNSSFLIQMVDFGWRQEAGAQSWAEHPPFELESQRSIQIDIIFNPTTTDLQCPGEDPAVSCGHLVVTTNGGVADVNIALGQSSGSIEVDPTVITFPDITGGPYSDTFTITNVGSGALSGITVTDPSVQGVTLQETSNRPEPFSLNVGEMAEYEVTFTPVAGVDYCGEGENVEDGCTLGLVVVDSNDVEGARTNITLIAGGIDSPDIEVSTDQLDFDSASVGNPQTLTVDVSNAGGANLNWNISISPPEARNLFALEVDGTAVPSTGMQMDALAPNNAATVEVTLDPTDESSVVAELVIRTNDPDESQVSVGLYGGAPAAELDVEPAQLMFPDVAPGSALDLQFVISNPGRAALQISSAAFQDEGEFAITPADLTATPIPPGGRLAVTATYDRPSDDLGGLDHNVLTIESNALSPNDTYQLNMFAFHNANALPPTAVIDVTPDEPYAVEQTITLSAADSEAPSSGQLPANPYRWVLLSAPAGSAVDLSSNFAESVTLIPDVVGTYSVMLTVTATIDAQISTQNQVTRNLLVQ